MRDSRINYVVVGIFSLAVLIGFVTALALLAGRTGVTDRYFTVLRSVPGIAPGTQVLFQGYRVGHVDELQPITRDGMQHYRLALSVRRGWQIPEDSTAFLTTGLLAAVNVNIDGGAAATFLEPGAEIRAREATDLFAALSSVAGEADSIIRNVDLILDKNVRPLFETVAREIGTLSGRLSALLSDANVESVGRIITNLDATADDVSGLAQELRETRRHADQMLGKVDALVDDNRGHVDQAVLDLRYALEAVARHIDAVSRNLEAASRNMNDFSREIRGNPAVLIRGKAAPEDGDGASR
jgi:phospholipid/cholesterol/gamma-HCH transport system substrate-binding protein